MMMTMMAVAVMQKSWDNKTNTLASLTGTNFEERTVKYKDLNIPTTFIGSATSVMKRSDIARFVINVIVTFRPSVLEQITAKMRTFPNVPTTEASTITTTTGAAIQVFDFRNSWRPNTIATSLLSFTLLCKAFIISVVNAIFRMFSCCSNWQCKCNYFETTSFRIRTSSGRMQ